MKKTEKITIILRDAQGRPHMVKVYVGSNVDIDIYGGNMVMNRPRRYDTNKIDESKQFKYDGGMEFKATRERVAKFNTYTNSYDAQCFIHEEWKKARKAIIEIAKKDKNGNIFFEQRDVTGLTDEEKVCLLEQEDCFYDNSEREYNQHCWEDINNTRKEESGNER